MTPDPFLSTQEALFKYNCCRFILKCWRLVTCPVPRLNSISWSIFSTSDRLLSDVLLLSKVREFEHFQCISVYWEAEFGLSHGLSRPRTLSLSQSNDWKQGQRVHGRPWEAEFGLSSPRTHTICHMICLSQSEIWSDSHERFGLTDSGRGNAFSREISQTGPRIVLPRPGRVRSVVRERPIGLSNLWGHVRERPWEAEHGLSLRTLRQITWLCEADL